MSISTTFKRKTVRRVKTCFNQNKATERKKKRRNYNEPIEVFLAKARKYQELKKIPQGIDVEVSEPSNEQEAFARRQERKRWLSH